MAHEIDTTRIGNLTLDRVGYFKDPAWHRLGMIIHEQLTAVEFGERIRLFWPVEQWDLIARRPDESEEVFLNSHVANMRVETVMDEPLRKCLGLVTPGYQVCQNRALAEFADALSSTGQITTESCGSLRGGELVWFLCRGEAYDIGGKGDMVYPYLLVSNGHDGGTAIRVTPTTVRVVCSNTLHMVVPRLGAAQSRAENAAFVYAHKGNLAAKLEDAKDCLRRYGQIRDQNLDIYTKMRNAKVTPAQAKEFFAAQYAANWTAATGEELNHEAAKVRELAERRMGRMKSAYNAFLERMEEEDSKVGGGYTAWGLMNAMTWYIQHARKAAGATDALRDAKQVESNLFGINALRTNEALNQAMALAG